LTYLVAALLGVIQGLTEFLPVSSTAHLLIAGRLLGFDDPGDAFTVMIQLGSILAVMWLYRRKIITVMTGLPSDPDARRFALVIVVASMPALGAGALLSGYIKTVLYNSFGVIAAAFIIGGVVMLLVERFRPHPTVLDAEQIPVPKAFGVGLCQMLALLPGVSRSGATIVGGLMLGIDRAAAAELSFFLAMPIMIAAFAHDLLEVKDYLSAERGIEIAIGCVTAFIASALVVRPFLGFIRKAGFAPFGWYRIALGVALLAAHYSGWGQSPEP
jgi:undecaprenyl-diphosphatase